jgi:hypothetical protein
MPKYLVVHPVGKDVTLEASRPGAEAIKAAMTTDAYWLRSEYAREEGKIYCHWDARDADAIRQVLAKAAPDLPTEGIYEIVLAVDSEDYR